MTLATIPVNLELLPLPWETTQRNTFNQLETKNTNGDIVLQNLTGDLDNGKWELKDGSCQHQPSFLLKKKRIGKCSMLVA